MNIFRKKWMKANEIRQNSGLVTLLQAGLRFLIKPIYQRDSYYLFKYDISKAINNNYTKPMLKNYDLIFKVVSSNQEADNLDLSGYHFRSVPTESNYNLKHYTRLLDKGAVAICAFYEKELVAIMWEILSKETQNKLTLPLKVDYSNHEAFTRGAWVNPKYRRLGFYASTRGARDRFLTEIGVKTILNAIGCTNKNGMTLEKSNQSVLYGRATSNRILFWRIWKETYGSSEQNIEIKS